MKRVGGREGDKKEGETLMEGSAEVENKKTSEVYLGLDPCVCPPPPQTLCEVLRATCKCLGLLVTCHACTTVLTELKVNSR